MKEFNKLVRDKIPQIIEKNGGKPLFRKLEGEEYYRELCRKLAEETNEFLESDEFLELADICEVLSAILKYKNIDPSELCKAIENKALERGGFANRVFLIGVE